ncbi:uncharacterized protein LOC111088984, partial [Limulus polyphemus]|uniref:Uncharacterized protein LOC111088984 n=1 Tax=Limulus polyphemus TaxID=6850 RepID=A0ABM1TJY8_LIMPO
CFMIKLPRVLYLDVNEEYETISLSVFGENVPNLSIFTCDFVPKFNASSKIKTPKLEKYHSPQLLSYKDSRSVILTWKMESDCTLGLYSLRCVVQINNTTHTVESEQDGSIFILNSNTQRIVNGEPTTIRLGSQQKIELKLKGFPPMKYELSCWGFSGNRISRFPTRRIADDVIQCDISQVNICEFNMTVQTSKKFDQRFGPEVQKQIKMVSYLPAVLSAYLTTDLLEIHINFNTSMVLTTNNCSLIFDASTIQLYGLNVLGNYPGLLSTNASITVKTTTAPLMAFIPSLYQVYFNQTFCIDGSLSADLGRQQGELKFLWICSKNNSNGCYVRDRGGRGYIRLEQWLQETTAPSICIPGGLLNSGLYKFTLTVSKDVRKNIHTCVVELKEKNDGVEVIIQRVTEPDQSTLLNAIVRSNTYKFFAWKLMENGFYRTRFIANHKTVTFRGYVSVPLYYFSLPYKEFGQIKCLAVRYSYQLLQKGQCVEILYKSPPRNGVLKEIQDP